jgi:hypothetical protein
MATIAGVLLRNVSKRDKKKGHKKARRWNRPRSLTARILCAKRKETRREASEAAAKRNAELRAAGLPTPWEIAKAKRYAARH